jgi:5,6-dimethylbenzimidazole synthase
LNDVPEFEAEFRAGLSKLFLWRRDVRRFKRDPLPHGTLDRLFELASLAPSVGLSEPWRFVVVESAERRRAIKECFERCNAAALADHSGERASLYARLKLAGLDDAPSQFAVFADHSTDQGHGLGRHTMPASIDHSVVMAVHTLWLAARAEGLGLGWVSIVEPAFVRTILDVPSDWTLIGYFCLGYPAASHIAPELEREGWEARRAWTYRVLRR